MIPILAWLARIPRWLWAAALILLAGAALAIWFRASLGGAAKQASATAQAIERSNQQQEVLNNVKIAKDAADNPSNAAVERVRSKYDRSYPCDQ